MPMYSQYIYSLIMFTVNNKHFYITNNEIHNYRTRYNNHLHLPKASLTKFNKGTHFTSTMFFNNIPEHKILTNLP